MPIKRLEDIEREKAEERRENFKKQVTEDAKDVIEGVFGPKKNKSKNAESDIFWRVIKIILFIFLFIFMINFILGNIWLLKFFLKELFGLEMPFP